MQELMMQKIQEYFQENQWDFDKKTKFFYQRLYTR